MALSDGAYPRPEGRGIAPVQRIKGGTGASRFEDFVELVKWIYEATEPQYVYGMHDLQREEIGWTLDEPVTTKSLADDRITQPTWLMVFPPAMVENYGRDWILSLPVARTEELDDGAILTISVDDFSDHEMAVDILQSMADATDRLTDVFDEHTV